MSALKCPQCGLVNFATAPDCKRCKYPIGNPPPAAQQAAYAAQPGGYQSSWSQAGTYTQPQGDYSQQDYTRNDFRRQRGQADVPSGVWRDGKLLVMLEDAVLPDRCVHCNAPAQQHQKRKLEWCPQYVSVLMATVRLVGMILYFFKRRRATIYIGMCQTHVNKRRNGQLLGGGFVVFGLLLGALTALINDFTPLCVGVVAFFVGAIILAITVRTVTADKIDEPYIWLKGVHEDFLKTLPTVS